jgi:hypothetical protein
MFKRGDRVRMMDNVMTFLERSCYGDYMEVQSIEVGEWYSIVYCQPFVDGKPHHRVVGLDPCVLELMAPPTHCWDGWAMEPIEISLDDL